MRFLDRLQADYEANLYRLNGMRSLERCRWARWKTRRMAKQEAEKLKPVLAIVKKILIKNGVV